MKRRCLNPTDKEKRNYQSKNITLCDEWINYPEFRRWALSNGYSDDLTIDRKDNSKGYHPKNCRFVDRSTQNANKGITRKNKTGFVGIYFSGSRFRSAVDWKKERIEIGVFDTEEEAAKARDAYIIKNNLPHILSGSHTIQISKTR